MLKERIHAASPIARKIRQTEDSFNTTIQLLGELIAGIPAARKAPGTHAPLTIGMDACEQLAQAAVTTAQGYRSVVAAHGHLAEDRDNLGLPARGFGDIFECPKQAEATTQPVKMRIVKAG